MTTRANMSARDGGGLRTCPPPGCTTMGDHPQCKVCVLRTACIEELINHSVYVGIRIPCADCSFEQPRPSSLWCYGCQGTDKTLWATAPAWPPIKHVRWKAIRMETWQQGPNTQRKLGRPWAAANGNILGEPNDRSRSVRPDHGGNNLCKRQRPLLAIRMDARSIHLPVDAPGQSLNRRIWFCWAHAWSSALCVRKSAALTAPSRQ